MKFIILCLSVILLCTAVQAQKVVVIRGPSQPINPEMQKEIIDSVCNALNEVYVFPEKARQMEKHLRDKFKNKAYQEIKDRVQFTMRLTDDLHEISKDGHLAVFELPPDDPELTDPDDMTLEQRQKLLEELAYDNFGFVRLERLPGNIGYLRMDAFENTSMAGSTAIAAMNFLGHCDAIIFDLRHNGGGDPSMIQLISSYFFDEPVHLNSFYVRRTDSINQFWTQAQVIGPRMTDVDIYILTSSYTFSGAEEFTYNLKNLKRATVIGETTGGGAHPTAFRSFPNLNITMSLPFGRAINPITGTNWEGTGVKPHIEVPQEQALDVAVIEALKKLSEKAYSPEKEAQIEWVMMDRKAEMNRINLDEEALIEYTGNYGPRKITLENEGLYYQREGGPKLPITPLGDDWFELKDRKHFRVQFVRDKSGRISEIVGHYIEGFTDRNKRDN